jgi:hypothetical protein
MREIKFRAWHLNILVMENNVHQLDRFSEIIASPEKYELMQYAGLKDKNGKEIYEGDIVQRGIVMFDRGKFQGFYYESGGGIAERWEDDLYQERNIEVLGNIYENPELLK